MGLTLIENAFFLLNGVGFASVECRKSELGKDLFHFLSKPYQNQHQSHEYSMAFQMGWRAPV